MKTLRNTSIIVLAAVAFGFVNVFATMKVGKIKTSSALVKAASIPTKVKDQSEMSLREIISDVLNNGSITESGKINIIFKVTPDKQIQILNVYGKNPYLVSSVRSEISKTVILVPDAVIGTYKIAVLF